MPAVTIPRTERFARAARSPRPQRRVAPLIALLMLSQCAAPADEAPVTAQFDGTYRGLIERVDSGTNCSATRPADLVVRNGRARIAWSPESDLAGRVGSDGDLGTLRMQQAAGPNWQFTLGGRIAGNSASFDATATGAGPTCRWRFEGTRVG